MSEEVEVTVERETQLWSTRLPISQNMLIEQPQIYMRKTTEAKNTHIADIRRSGNSISR
jgi:hypothetical protein